MHPGSYRRAVRAIVPVVALPMALPPALASAVPNNIRSRGAAYFAAGAVKRLDLSGGVLAAQVQGSESYDVWIEPHGDLLRASCTCQYFLDRFLVCKHIWAALLAADSRQLLTFSTANPTVDIEPVDIDDDEDLDPLPPPRYPRAGTPPTPRRPKVPPPRRA